MKKTKNVSKFGGDSINERILPIIAQVILNALKEGKQIICVFSAMAGMTNLLEEIESCDKPNHDNHKVLALLDKFELAHLRLISELFKDAEKKIPNVEKLFDQLRHAVFEEEFADRDARYSNIVQYGELLSAEIVSAYLDLVSIEHSLLDARDHVVTTDDYKNAKILQVKDLEKHLDKDVIVISGFIGSDKNGGKTTLPKNGSDLSLAWIATTCQDLGYVVHEATFWKKVLGVSTKDPNLHQDAMLLSDISPMNYVNMCFDNNTYVVFPQAIIKLAKGKIPARVRSHDNLESIGTLIS